MGKRPVLFVSGCVAIAVVAAALCSRSTRGSDSASPPEVTGAPETRARSQAVGVSKGVAQVPKPDGPYIGVPEVYVDGQRIEEDAAPSVEASLVATEDRAQVRALGVVLDRSAGDAERHRAANQLRRSGCPDLQPALLEVLHRQEEGERFRSWAVQHLYVLASTRKDAADAEIEQVLRDALGDRHPAVRRESLLALSRLGADGVLQVAVEWLDEPPVADLAIRILREQGATGYACHIRPLLTDAQAPDAARIAAIVTLAEWQDSASREILVSLVQERSGDRVGRIVRSAREALDHWKDL